MGAGGVIAAWAKKPAAAPPTFPLGLSWVLGKVLGLCVLVTPQHHRGQAGEVTRGPSAASCRWWLMEQPLLTAGFADAVDGRHPEVGGACVEDHGEVLGGCPDGDLPEILHLAKSRVVSR